MLHRFGKLSLHPPFLPPLSQHHCFFPSLAPFLRSCSLKISLRRTFRGQTKAFTSASAASAAVADSGNGADTFFASGDVDWTSLGVSDTLSESLFAAGFRCLYTINDTVVAAETGSGKTHGYLVPLLDKLHQVPAGSGNINSGHDRDILNRLCLVLCPNVMLCEQVVRMANCLCGEDGEPLLKAAAISGRQDRRGPISGDAIDSRVLWRVTGSGEQASPSVVPHLLKFLDHLTNIYVCDDCKTALSTMYHEHYIRNAIGSLLLPSDNLLPAQA
ncbi:hypothetical protein Dimus_015044 [Dionaea muscipula]